MSQAKVDKYKEEKKKRAKVVKRARVKKVAVTLLWAAILGVIIGFPLGRIMYNRYYDKKMEDATISTTIYDYWYQEYWDLHFGDKFTSSTTSTESTLTDDQIEELMNELNSASDAVIVTPDDIDQDALEEAIEAASSTDAQ